jgi:excisionase family DNA binding protein
MVEAPKVYTRQAAAQRLTVGITTLEKLLATKQLKCIRIGTRVMVSENAINEFIRKNEK